jgi:hypothetical protein
VPEEAEPVVDIGLGEGQVAYEAADFFFGRGVTGVAAEGQDFEEENGQAFAFLCGGEWFFERAVGQVLGRVLGGGRGGVGLTDELI